MTQFELESVLTGDVIDLDSLLNTDEGVQAIEGLTGFGLPPVDVQFQSGAGDGARYRGRRVLPQNIDLPLYFEAGTRADLRFHLNRVVKALAGECILRWQDVDRTLYIKVHRVGGGDYVYGKDTQGSLFIQFTVTLRATDPFWTETITWNQFLDTNTLNTDGYMRIEPGGTAPARPVWKLAGPGIDYKLTRLGRNLAVNGEFETDVTGWAATAGSVVWEENDHGTMLGYAALTSTGASTMDIHSSGSFAVSGGLTYFAAADFEADGAERSVEIVVDWYQGVTLLSSATVASGVEPTFPHVRLAGKAVAPPGATKARLRQRVLTPGGAGELHMIDNIVFAEVSSDVLHFADFIPKGDTITLDTATGKVVDQSGTSRYSGLAPAPRFFSVGPDPTYVLVEVDRSSDTYTAYLSGNRYNFVTNPTLEVDDAGWGLSTGVTRDSTNKYIAFGAGTTPGLATTSVSGLVVGRTYQAFINKCSFTAPVAGETEPLPGRIDVVTGDTSWGTSLPYDNADGSDRRVVTFVAKATTATINIIAPHDPTLSVRQAGWVDEIYLGEYTSTYFDGSSADTSSANYSWEGTAHASRSKFTVLGTADTTRVDLYFSAREWLVI